MALSLEISNIKKSFGEKVILSKIDLDAREGNIIGVLGKSGCGKSTLLKVLVGFHRPDHGRILINGKDIGKDKMQLRKLVGYTTQENSFYDKLSIMENMRYYARLYGLPSRQAEGRILKLLSQVGLLEHAGTLAEDISGGMKRRLDFAISLIHDPTILILDEPTTGLDPILVHQFWQIVFEVVAKGNKIVIMTSHILSEIEDYCTHAAFIDEGRIKRVLTRKDMKGLEERFLELLK